MGQESSEMGQESSEMGQEFQKRGKTLDASKASKAFPGQFKARYFKTGRGREKQEEVLQFFKGDEEDMKGKQGCFFPTCQCLPHSHEILSLSSNILFNTSLVILTAF